MGISPEEERLYKEKERLERELEISEYIREQEKKGAELDKENLKSKHSEIIAILAVFLFCAVVFIITLTRNQ